MFRLCRNPCSANSGNRAQMSRNLQKQRYQYNLDNFTHKKLFVYIKFSVINKRLTTISLCLPDENGNMVDEMTLLDRQTLKLLVA